MVKRTYGVPPPPFPPAPPNPFRRAAPTPTPKCMVCTTPTRCGAPALHTKGPRCIGRADGKDDCDCLNACGDDPWIESGRSMPCEHRRETQARIAALTTAAPAAVAGPVAFTAEHVTYIRRYGGSCRDCADENGVCPNRGLPCADSEKAIRFVLEALAYGINHGYIAAPTTQPAPQQEPDEISSYIAARAWVARAAQEGN